MTAQIISLAERREVIRRRNDPFAISFIWPGIFITGTAFWFGIGFAVMRAWPLVSLSW